MATAQAIKTAVTNQFKATAPTTLGKVVTRTNGGTAKPNAILGSVATKTNGGGGIVTTPKVAQTPVFKGATPKAKAPAIVNGTVKTRPTTTTAKPVVVPTTPAIPQPTRISAEDYYTKMADSINSMYANQKTQVAGSFDADKQIAAQQYNANRNQASVNASKNTQALREQMANQGLFNSGDNITANVNIGNQRSADIAGYNQEEQNYYAKIQQQIANRQGEIDNQNAQALIGAMNTADDKAYRDNQAAYSQYRDTIGDNRYNDQTAYSKSRDTLADTRYDLQTAYSQGRDTLADTRYDANIKYTLDRDKITDTRYDETTAYTKDRDKLSDTRYDDTTKYNRDRDIISDTRYTDETKYDRGRDVVTDKNYADQVAYQKQKDALDEAYRQKQLAESQRRSSGGSGSGGGKSSSSNLTNFLQQFDKYTKNGTTEDLQNGQALLNSNMDTIRDTYGEEAVQAAQKIIYDKTGYSRMYY